jgi:hypothetical protein
MDGEAFLLGSRLALETDVVLVLVALPVDKKANLSMSAGAFNLLDYVYKLHLVI